jgi:hypothetical protein
MTVFSIISTISLLIYNIMILLRNPAKHSKIINHTMSTFLPFDGIRRAAFDIGSSATKIQCADYEEGLPLNTIIGQERPVSFGVDYLKSADGCLSESIQLKGLEVLEELKYEAEKSGATQFSAIATEVFRKAVNGHQYLDRVSAMGIPVTILTQDLEAKLGYNSAILTAGVDANSSDYCVWDSGGASFQISTRDKTDETGNSFCTYMGSLGSSVCSALLIREVQGRSLDTTPSPNPVSLEEAQQLVERLTALLQPVPEWLKDKSEVIAVTGKNSIFKVCCNVLTDLSKQDYAKPLCPGLFRTDSLPDSSAVTSFSSEDAELALSTCIGCSDEDLCKYVNFQYSDGPKIMVPKLCLLVAVMRHTGIQRINTVKCIGSCAAVICDERFWTHYT